jgi:uncharacterized protein (TIGR02246 family)
MVTVAAVDTDPSPSTADAIVASYRALNAGDVEGAMQVLAEDAEWHESEALPDAGSYRGRDAIQAFLEEFLASWKQFHQQVQAVRRHGDRFAVLIHLSAIGRGSEVSVEADYAHVWTVRDGEGARVDAFYDTDAALRYLEEEREE